MSQKPKIILLHGLAETPARMAALAFWIGQNGYKVDNVFYPSNLYTAEQLIEGPVADIIKRYKNEDEIVFVTHSLGGVLLHCYLQRYQIENLKCIVALAPAYHGSEMLAVYRYNPLFQYMGPVLQQSGRDKDCFTNAVNKEANYDLGVIAGCIPGDPLSLPFIKWPQDGRASVETTKLKGMKDHIVIPSGHEMITFNPLAIAEVLCFIEYGRFRHNYSF